MQKVTLFVSILLFLASANSKPRIVTKLTHICSKSTTQNVGSCIEDISNTRLAYLKSRLGVSAGNVEADLYANRYGYVYFASISIGTPPVPQQLIMDTGSRLLWVQCRPCEACKVHPYKERIFDPSESSTYSKLSCFHPLCDRSICGACGIEDVCEFDIRYLDTTYASGELSNETITFSSGGAEISIPNIVFGCVLDDNETDEESNGILGLNVHYFSLVSQLGASAFSYCLGDILNTEYEHTKLVIGDSSIIKGKSTPFEVYKSHYYLHLEGISVGEKRLTIDPAIFQRKNSSGGVLIDSGATVTYLRRSAFNQLKEEVLSLVDEAGLKRIIIPQIHDRLCYIGSLTYDLPNFPAVTFHFAGGADLVLYPESVFSYVYPGKAFCFSFGLSENLGIDYNIIGLNTQQNYNIGYDLSERTVSFQMIDCESLFPDD